jgi:S-adenosylmethionine decarboxylase|tara:strand:- start:1064 stop:1231 length:168 start_codon:yes stop_codon:yes gene_type:complete
MHWKESGMHIYGWDDRKPPFFSIDIYTCKKFDPMDAVRYTEEFFGENLIQVEWKE